MDKLSWRMFEERYTCTVEVHVNVHESRVLTSCGCAGQGVMAILKRDIHVYAMEDVKRDIHIHVNVHRYTCKWRVLTGCGCAGSDGQGVRRGIQCTCTCTV